MGILMAPYFQLLVHVCNKKMDYTLDKRLKKKFHNVELVACRKLSVEVVQVHVPSSLVHSSRSGAVIPRVSFETSDTGDPRIVFLRVGSIEASAVDTVR